MKKNLLVRRFRLGVILREAVSVMEAEGGAASDCHRNVRMSLRQWAIVVLFIVMLVGCADTHQPYQDVKPGADRDEHGCIASAGYLWCARTGRCERPWELAAKHEFPNTQEAFTAYCSKLSENFDDKVKP